MRAAADTLELSVSVTARGAGMRRIRRGSPIWPQALFSRMSAAVAVSAALHLSLIYLPSPPAGSSPVMHPMVLDARLQRAPSPSPGPHVETPERPGAHSPATMPAVVTVPSPAIPLVQAAPLQSAADPEPEAIVPTAAVIDTVHYAAKELDIYPQALRPITPNYPSAALEARTAGSVTLLVLIDEVGRVIEASVTDSAPAGLFEVAAQQAVANAQFRPAQKDGRTVRSQILIRVEFDATSVYAGQ